MPVGSWSPKDDRMYKHIVESYRAKGGSKAKRATEIATRTVNAHRSDEGRTAMQRHLKDMVAKTRGHGGMS